MRPFQFGLAVLLAIFLISCTAEKKKVMFQGQTQGTYYAVTYFDVKGRNFQQQIDSVLHAFDLSVSMWNPASILSRINSGDSLALPDDWFTDIFNRSHEISAQTNGAFDITVGPLVNAWGFGFKGRMNMDQEIVDSLKELVDYKTVRLEDGRIKMDKKNIQIDFNAIAQGYSVDVISKFIESKGIRNYLVDIGGEVFGRGSKPDGKPWLVGIENPTTDSLEERTINAMVRLKDRAISTSGSYRKYYEENGIRYSHTIDPVTGYPVRHSLLSVSVLAKDCATADGYATAFMVMGFEKSKEFLEHQTGMEAFFINDGGNGTFQTWATEGFREIIEK
jgi:thiamine biosynthesis lipoprotein